MRPFASRIFAMALAFAMAAPLFAATYIVPPDRDIVRSAKAIVIATGVSSYSVAGDDGRMTYTMYRMRVDQVLKGNLRVTDAIELKQPGGCLGTRCVSLSDMPTYQPGERALVFMESDSRGNWSTWSGALGKFNFVHDVHGKKLLVRGGTDGEVFGWDAVGNAHIEQFRDEERFLAYVRAVIGGEHPVEDYVVPRTEITFERPVRENVNSQGFHASNYVVSPPRRWKCIFDQPANSMPGCTGGNSSVTFTLFGTASGGVNGSSAASAGMAAWNGDTLSNVSYNTGGSVGAAPWNQNDEASSIHFDDDADVTAGCGGSAIGCGGSTYDPTQHTFDGSGFGEIVAGDVAIKIPGSSNFPATQTFYSQVVCHEIGHTLGLRHSDQGSPSTTNAVMNSCAGTGPGCNGTFGASLKTWDHDAISTLYNPSPAGTCSSVSITTQPQSTTITSGSSTTLSVSATGTAPLTYQWYRGNSGDTSSGVLGTNSSFNTGTLSTTTSYWVRVSNSCPSSSDSNTATVTVNTPTCTPPNISTHPSGTTITQGQSAQLSVSAAGTGPLSYQWFIGGTGDTSQFAGSGNPITLSPSTTTRYWVRVTGQCAPAADSTPATITVTPNDCPNVTVGTPTATQLQSGQYSLDVTASSGTRPLTYQWFQGPVPGSGTPVGNTKQLIVPAPTQPTSYWVRVQNDCGKEASSATVVTISPCQLPIITTEPADASITTGASANLTVVFTSATTATVTWYRGAAPDKTNLAGTGATLNTGALSTTTQFWASIVNSCGEKLSRTVTVTVGTACFPPAILSQSNSTTKFKGETVLLTVIATGTETLHYEWYDGVSGDQSRPIGTDSNSFTSAVLTSPKLFWVKVRNSCGSANSNTIVVDVKPPKYRSVRH
jgi:hypothetical protein